MTSVMEKEKIISVQKIGEKLYSEVEFKFAQNLMDNANEFNLEDNSILASFFMNIELNEQNQSIINNEFGNDVLSKIELLQRISSISIPERKKQIETLRNLFLQITTDLSVIFIILIERLTSLQYQDRTNHKNLEQTAEECLFLYGPIAQRLGMSKIYNPMEDIAFRVLYPDQFKRLDNAIESRKKYFNRKLALMKKEVLQLMAKNNIPVKMQARVKRPYSIHRKIQNKGVTLDEIYDLLALRVITDTSENCYQALGLVHSTWMPIEGRFRDWITFPKKNGYRSIQTTVRTKKEEKYEIQIRTNQMHREAEYGSAAHWSYKQGGDNAEVWINRLKEFLSNDEYFEKPEEVFEKLKSEINRDKIFVLTPKGEIIGIRKGSTPIDFAFAVHTELGNKVTGARVNGRFAKLNTELNSGDVVQVISSKNATPSRDWLEFVKSPRAKSKIQRWFKQNEKQLFINDGKKSYDKLRRRYKKRLEGFDSEDAFNNYLKKNNFNDENDFYYSIAHNHVKISLKLLKNIFPKAFEKDREKKKISKDKTKVKKNIPFVKVEGLKGIETKIAKCCNPVKGEPIIAYVTKREGVKIHHRDCQFLANDSINTENLKRADWMNEEYMQTVKLRIFGYDYSKLIKIFNDETADKGFTVVKKSKEYAGKHIECLLTEIEIKNIVQLNSFITTLKKHNEIESVKKV